MSQFWNPRGGTVPPCPPTKYVYVSNMGRHILKRAKLNSVARHYDPYVQGNNGHNGVRQNSTWPISIRGDPYVVVVVWKRSVVPCPILPPITNYAWEEVDGKIKPLICYKAPVPQTLLELRKCNCKMGCKSNICGCVRNKLQCTDLCLCNDCLNTPTEKATAGWIDKKDYK